MNGRERSTRVSDSYSPAPIRYSSKALGIPLGSISPSPMAPPLGFATVQIHTIRICFFFFFSSYELIFFILLGLIGIEATEEEVAERAAQWDQPVSEYLQLAEQYLGFQQPNSIYSFSDALEGSKRVSSICSLVMIVILLKEWYLVTAVLDV